MRLPEIEASLDSYEQAFADFYDAHDLPLQLFKHPDHFAVKCADARDYTETLHSLQARSDLLGMWESIVDDRRLASVALAREVEIEDYSFKWIEVMEPRAGKELTKGFVEHTEFHFPKSADAVRLLRSSGVEEKDIEHQDNKGHKWVCVTIDDKGHEIKFNDKTMAVLVMEGMSRGTIRTIVKPIDNDGMGELIDLAARRKKK